MNESSNFPRCSALVLAVITLWAARTEGRTVKILADWYNLGTTDTIVRIDSVYIPRIDGVQGYYQGARSQMWIRTGDYAAPVAINPGYRNDTLPAALRIPTALERWWFTTPDFRLGDYPSGKLRFYLDYLVQKHFPLLNRPDPRVDVDTIRLQGSTTQLLTSFFDSCLAVHRSETVWFWSGATKASQVASFPSSLRCEDHNPFFASRGRVRVYVPQAGARVTARFGNKEQVIFPGPEPDWYYATLFDHPDSPLANSLTFKVETARGETWIIDSLGHPFHLTDTAAVRWIAAAPQGGLPVHALSKPTDSVVIAWSNPWQKEVSFATLGGGERIVGDWKAQGWFVATLPFRPARAWLVSGSGSDSTPAVAIPATGTDTVWLASRTTLPDRMLIQGLAYDYSLTPTPTTLDDHAYFPFTQATNTELLLGLVKPKLGEDGFPVWSGQSICGSRLSDPKCLLPANAPDMWFRSQPGKNAEFPITVMLMREPNNIFRHSNDLYFPLDTCLKLPSGEPNRFHSGVVGYTALSDHNFGYCVVFRGDAQLVPHARMTFSSDDDSWIFVDGRLAIDLGGQHGLQGRSVELEGFVGNPAPPVVRLDIFHCERHYLESGLRIDVNFPIFPAGSIGLPPRTVSGAVPRRNPASFGIAQRTGALQVDVPVGRAWALEVRAIDGRILSSRAGSGPATLPWRPRGFAVATLRSHGEVASLRIVGGR